MTKRQQLNYDSENLVHNLKASTGQGVNAFFSDPSPTPKLAQPTAAPKQRAQHKAAAQPIPQTPARTGERPTGHTDSQMWQIPEIPKQRRPERYAFRHGSFCATNIFTILAAKMPVFESSTRENGNPGAPENAKMLWPVLNHAQHRNPRAVDAPG